MCQFFSLISDGQGHIRYFDHKQRMDKVKMPDGSNIDIYDSHTSIATFYGLTGSKEDTWNKWEYNPFTGKLVLDKQNTANDRASVFHALEEIDWHALCGNVDAVRQLIVQVNMIPWFKNGGVLPEGVKLYETLDAARDAAWGAARDAACLAGLLVCDGLEIDPKHMEHMRKRWAVWEAGYGVLCDVGGVIYAYKKP